MNNIIMTDEEIELCISSLESTLVKLERSGEDTEVCEELLEKLYGGDGS